MRGSHLETVTTSTNRLSRVYEYDSPVKDEQTRRRREQRRGRLRSVDCPRRSPANFQSAHQPLFTSSQKPRVSSHVHSIDSRCPTERRSTLYALLPMIQTYMTRRAENIRKQRLPIELADHCSRKESLTLRPNLACQLAFEKPDSWSPAIRQLILLPTCPNSVYSLRTIANRTMP